MCDMYSVFFFFKQKTAYDMRISDWSSDVCSSDLRGASDFLEKPFEANQLVLVVTRATETERLRRENETLRSKVGLDEELTGNSTAINNVRATLKRVAVTGSRVLITGPAGAGKEVAARLLHLWSSDRKSTRLNSSH